MAPGSRQAFGKEFFGCSKNQRIPFIHAASKKSLAMASLGMLNPGIRSF